MICKLTKIHIIALLFSAVILAGCHDTENTFYESGELECKYQYKKDTKIKDGVQKCFYKDGKLEREERYKNGEKNGVWKEWYENGQLDEEEHYKDGKKDGVFKYWYNKNGQLWREEHYKDGKKDGVFKSWYKNGQLRREEHYRDGVLDGVWKEWSEDGELEHERTFSKDEGINGVLDEAILVESAVEDLSASIVFEDKDEVDCEVREEKKREDPKKARYKAGGGGKPRGKCRSGASQHRGEPKLRNADDDF